MKFALREDESPSEHRRRAKESLDAAMPGLTAATLCLMVLTISSITIEKVPGKGTEQVSVIMGLSSLLVLLATLCFIMNGSLMFFAHMSEDEGTEKIIEMALLLFFLGIIFLTAWGAGVALKAGGYI